ncbi:hypothetical protein SAMN02745164_00070 [Marinitoga hydrogenitolerans DSM 16785]|uniref:Calcineurin-like phosphoesterase domain-containing protein n=1 Tax=Marinitoga hydrogenitolerans (strain DSM 16785 / JCM 12826 / AT1271) TaxID=1122195 RepID=A0A1M4S621_MARH1|nr:metallophosphoesterase [Marinitoga hydrogenitolerans]SHE27653.1 hypothetical protein SAMN02745164_00070 [Marinitoga hydrogenitolerans DSM 16785]
MTFFKRSTFLIIIIVIYAFFIEPFSIKKNYLNIKIPNLNSKIKIIHITDLHIYKYIFFHDKILNNIKQENPDLILYTGDSIIKNTVKNDLNMFFKALNEISPVYAVYGNWDYYNLNLINDVYNKNNIHLINDNTTSIYFNDFSLKLVGLPIYKKLSYSDTTPASYTIVLEHIPDTILYNKEIFDQANLILAGHTHGGQVYIPFITKYFLKQYAFYLRGEMDFSNNKIMYINRGLGSWFNLRLFSPPEILIIKLSNN